MRMRAFAGIAMLLVVRTIAWPAESELQQAPLWVGDTDGYHTYRIPSLIVTKQGTLLAFCEGRKRGTSDTGDIDLLCKRSTDGGRTWGAQAIVWDDGANTCGNPCPVIDEETGTVWLLMTHNLGEDQESEIVGGTSKGTRTAWVTHSTDDGRSWAQPTDTTSAVKKPEWTWYATGPGVGIQLRRGPHTGRLVVPCDHKTRAPNVSYFSHVIFSDDRGRTWQLGGATENGVNECQVIERVDGSLLLNMRVSKENPATLRAIATSADAGRTWSPLAYDAALIGPRCQASLARYHPSDAPGKPLVLFSNTADPGKRIRMTVRLSEDDGRTWSAAGLLHEGPSAYSCLAALPDGGVACLYERGEKNAYETITLARFPLEWLTSGAK